MIKGLVIFRNNTAIYRYSGNLLNDETFLGGFISAVQAFSESLFSQDRTKIHSIEAGGFLFTFRTVSIKGKDGKEIEYQFVLQADARTKEKEQLQRALELIIAGFLSYERGQFKSLLRDPATDPSAFRSFDQVMADLTRTNLNAVEKVFRPVPDSFVQGLLYEAGDYLSPKQIASLHPRLVTIGQSLVWLTDDLPPEEEKQLIESIRNMLTKLYGASVYESLADRVMRQLKPVQ
ncbi:MAG: hypothetical protein QXS20_03685 [Candidatus Thorarchaeota archaeon]